MNFVDLIRWFASLAVVLGLIGLSAVAYRRYGPDVLKKLAVARGPRRLALIESLMLDPQRRLVLVSLDGQERLVLLGEGSVLASPSPPAPRATRSKSAEAA